MVTANRASDPVTTDKNRTGDDESNPVAHDCSPMLDGSEGLRAGRKHKESTDSINKVSEGGILPRPDYGRLVFRMNSERIEKTKCGCLGALNVPIARRRCSTPEAQASVRSEPF